MSHDLLFATLLQRVRAGDPQAAATLIRRYEPQLRLEVRVRLHDLRLRRLFDSMDICQSVLGSFFLRVAAGQYDLETPQHLLKLLLTMTRNKLIAQVRRQRRQRRDNQRLACDASSQLLKIVAPGSNPSQQVACQELLKEARRRLSTEEQRVLDLRDQGCGWGDIAEKLGGTADGRRKQLGRALDRVARQLGLEDGDL
jgi:RNA polymerase sigma factor (sigma-70 family)